MDTPSFHNILQTKERLHTQPHVRMKGDKFILYVDTYA